MTATTVTATHLRWVFTVDVYLQGPCATLCQISDLTSGALRLMVDVFANHE